MPTSRHRNVERRRKPAASKAIKRSSQEIGELASGGGGSASQSVRASGKNEAGPNWVILGAIAVGFIAVLTYAFWPQPKAPAAATVPPVTKKEEPKQIITLPDTKKEEPKPVTPPPTQTETPPAGFKTQDLVVGKGKEATPGASISVRYTGKLANGTVFDSSAKHGNEPFNFVLGSGQVIKGWDKGFAGMKVGGKRRLTIPSEWGYGDAGSPPSIPPKSTLTFDVELVDVK